MDADALEKEPVKVGAEYNSFILARDDMRSIAKEMGIADEIPDNVKGIFDDTIDIANLTVKDISSWFKTKISDINQDNKVCVVSYFRSDLLKGYNIKLDETVNTANKLLQLYLLILHLLFLNLLKTRQHHIIYLPPKLNLLL